MTLSGGWRILGTVGGAVKFRDDHYCNKGHLSAALRPVQLAAKQ
jgi:hypothetical protein